jgi:hypothetical protein
MDWQNLATNKWFLLITILWVIPWKGMALWKAARRQEKYWFVVILILNTYALLEILYIFVFAKETTAERIKNFFKKITGRA